MHVLGNRIPCRTSQHRQTLPLASKTTSRIQRNARQLRSLTLKTTSKAEQNARSRSTPGPRSRPRCLAARAIKPAENGKGKVSYFLNKAWFILYRLLHSQFIHYNFLKNESWSRSVFQICSGLLFQRWYLDGLKVKTMLHDCSQDENNAS